MYLCVSLCVSLCLSVSLSTSYRVRLVRWEYGGPALLEAGEIIAPGMIFKTYGSRFTLILAY